ncbi:MAG: PPOX class F420-dependent oxidoreductase [Chloroflexota bacterium]
MSMEVEQVITPGNDNAFNVGEKKKDQTLADLDPVYLQLLDEPVTAALATMSKSGTMQLTPVWVNHDGEYVLLNSVRDRLKDRNMRARPNVTLLFINPKNPYHWMTIYGTIVEYIDEDDEENGHLATQNIDDLAESYLGERPYPLRDAKGEIRVLYRVQPTRIQTFGQP